MIYEQVVKYGLKNDIMSQLVNGIAFDVRGIHTPLHQWAYLFWPPSMVYISVIIIRILHITNHAGPSVWAAIHVMHSGHFFSWDICIQIWIN